VTKRARRMPERTHMQRKHPVPIRRAIWRTDDQHGGSAAGWTLTYFSSCRWICFTTLGGTSHKNSLPLHGIGFFRARGFFNTMPSGPPNVPAIADACRPDVNEGRPTVPRRT
jgi:hypothetical protein